MPGDPLRNLRPGDPIPDEAATFQAFIDTVKEFRASRRGRPKPGETPPPWPPGLVEVLNASGADADRFAVMGISGPAISPGETAEGFAERPRFEVVAPTEDHVGGRFVVLLEPAADGAVAVAAAGGVTVCKVNVSDTDHQFADAAAGTSTALVSAASGPVQILWAEPGTGSGKWAVVRFGAAGGPRAKWGKLTELWSPGDATVTLQPVANAAGTAFEDEPDPISAYIVMPVGTVPAYLHGEVDAVFAYEDLGGGVYLLKNPLTTPIPARKWEVIQDVREGSHPQWAADYMRAHEVP